MLIWVDDTMYVSFPFLCIILGTVGLLVPSSMDEYVLGMPSTIVKYACCTYLYMYALIIMIKRFSWRNTHVGNRF